MKQFKENSRHNEAISAYKIDFSIKKSRFKEKTQFNETISAYKIDF